MNEQTMRLIEKLDQKYGNAIPIFGGAIWVKCIEDIPAHLPHVVKTAQFFEWHDCVANACRTFCTLCGFDPALVEVLVGARFEALVI